VSSFDIDHALIEQAARMLITAADQMAANNPHPGGRTLRLTVAAIDGDTFGHVDIDVTNVWAMAKHAARRSGIPGVIRQTEPAPSGKPNLYLVHGEAR
jgi:hypothetical protein